MLVVKGGKAGGPLGEALLYSGMTAAVSARFLTMAALIVLFLVGSHGAYMLDTSIRTRLRTSTSPTIIYFVWFYSIKWFRALGNLDEQWLFTLQTRQWRSLAGALCALAESECRYL
jgi:hypothetical protein